MKRYILLLFLFICPRLFAQDFSNKGKDFWVGYGAHVNMYNSNGTVNTTGGSQDMVLYFTSDQDAVVTVQVPATGWTRTYNVKANAVTESDAMPKTGADDARLAAEGKSTKGIHITSDKPIVAYAHIYNASVSGATLLFPTPTLGQDYYVLGFTQVSNSAYSYPFAFVIATEDNTTVEITPSASTLTHVAGVAFTTTLNKGEVFNLLGALTGGSGSDQTGVDLSGTRIRTVSSGAGGCKKIAVFAGTGKLNIRCTTSSGGSSADNVIQQMFPSSAWGKKYITVPTKNMDNNFFRVMISDPATVVRLNGQQLTNLQINRFYQFQTNQPSVIEADQPVMVAQYISTANQCGNTVLGSNGDPEMICLSPVEQTISNITLNSTSHYAITSHFINVVMKTAATSTLRLDGNPVLSFQPVSTSQDYSYAQVPVGAGFHSLQADSGFNAIAYGYGSAESYGYNAGANMVDQYQYISVQSPYAKINAPATCVNNPVSLSITLPYQPVSISWDFGNSTGISPNTPITSNAPVPDSSFQKDAKTLYVFKLPGKYTFTGTGAYLLKVTVNNPTADGCSGLQELEYNMQVYGKPTADWKYTHTGCVNDSVYLSDASATLGRTISKYAWSFDDNTIDSVKSPVKKFTTAGTHNIKLQIITDIGCEADTTKPIAITTSPVASFTISDTTCVNSPVIFTSTSTIATGTLSKWYWDYNNGKKDTLTQGVSNGVLYATAGSYTPSLLVETSTGCKSSAVSKTFTIGSFPVAGFTMPAVCLSDAFAQFNDTSTVATANNTTLTYLWNFGDANATTVNNTATTASPKHKYTATGTYPVTETVTSANNCATKVVQQFTVNGAIPKADFSVLNAVLCSNKQVIIQNNSTVDIGSVTKTITYWDVANYPTTADTDIMPISQKTYTHQYPTPTNKASYTIRMVSYSGQSCLNTKDQTIVINVQPKAAFTSSATAICAGAAIQFTDNSNGYSSAIKSYNWIFGDAYTGSIQNPLHTYKDSGNYTAKLVVTNADLCVSDTATQAITVYPYPKLSIVSGIVVLEGGTLQLKPTYYANNGQFVWSPATYLNSATIAQPYTTPKDDITYTVTLTGDGGCAVSESIKVTVLKTVVPPNAFSPNGDGVNDTWHLRYLESYPDCTVEIYNRYGQQIFMSKGYGKDWDGTFNGKPLPVGTYYYIINPKNGREQIKGSVTILR